MTKNKSYNSFSRKVIQVTPALSEEENKSSSKCFGDYLDTKYLILLGDPGSGKSYLLKEFAEYSDSEFLKISRFTAKQTKQIPKRICIDGLDEKRADKNSSLIDLIAEKLQEVDPELCIISCRAADWRGSNDLEILNSFFDEKGGATVLSLEALSEPEQKDILKINNPKIDADDFLSNAQTFGLDGLLKNPQTLLMLADSVSRGDWPNTRKELFNNCCDFLLKEKNGLHAETDVGKYASWELTDTAGYIFACLLFSDIQGVSLNANQETTTHPYIRSLLQEPFNEDKIQAVVKRRIFTQDDEPHQVTYCHRTIAEFLAARWISQQIDKGLPIARVLAIMGVDGFPTSELRGVNAWLAIFQSNHHSTFIEKDPYGVLLYGDPAVLSISSKRKLLQSLHHLSIENPSFRQSYFSEPSFSGFISQEVVNELQNFLESSNTTFDFRSLLLELLYRSEPQPELYPTYQKMLFNEGLTFHDRHCAIELLAVEPEKNKEFIILNYPLLNDQSKEQLLRLKSEILRYWYQHVFTWEDLIIYVSEEFKCPPTNTFGVHHALPTEADCIKILDNFPNIKELAGENWSSISHQNNIYNIDSLYKHWLLKALNSQLEITGAQIYYWLSKEHHLNNFTSWDFELKEDSLIKILKTFSAKLAQHFEDIIDADMPVDQWIEEICKFPRITYWTIEHKKLFSSIISPMESITKTRLHALYPVALKICENTSETTCEEFEYLYNLPDVKNDEGLICIRNKCLYQEIPEWRIKEAKTKQTSEEKRQSDINENIKLFEEHHGEIESGKNLYSLNWLAHLYLGNVAGTNKKDNLQPLQIFDNFFGETDYQFILDGFVASIVNDDLPKIEEIAKLATKSRSYADRHVLYVGFFEKWRRNQDLQTWTKKELSFAILLDLDCSYFKKISSTKQQVRPEWFNAILEKHPELVVSTYYKYFNLQLDHSTNTIYHLTRLTHTDELKPFRKNPLIKLLKKSLSKDVAIDILRTLIHDGCTIQELRPFVGEALNSQQRLSPEPMYFWMILSMVDSDKKLQISHNSRIKTAAFFEYLARNFSDIDTLLKNETSDDKNAIYDMFITLISNQYQYRNYDLDSKINNRRGAEPIELVCSLINKISTATTTDSLALLNRYSQDSQLKSYLDITKKARYNQLKLVRERTFKIPDWKEVIGTLLYQVPSTFDDYFAFIVNNLDELLNEIRTDNANLYNLFWNTAKEGQTKIPTPKEENECRDALLALLKPRLPSYISVQPESAQVNEKRTDIVFEYPDKGYRLPLEAKRQHHEEIWTAAESQLFAKYMKDENLSGKGIYLIFWFGTEFIKKMRKRDSSMKQKPQSAAELKESLEEHLPSHLKNKIAARVLDISRPVKTIH